MAALYLTEQGAVLRKRGACLVVEKEGVGLLEVGINRIDAVLIFGMIQVSTQALVLLLEHGVELALLSREGRFRGQLAPPISKNSPLRIGQYRFSESMECVLPQARRLVQSKLRNSIEVLKQSAWRRGDRTLQSTWKELSLYNRKIEAAANLDELNGIEGMAARKYFNAFPALLSREPALFKGRSKRPPLDPVNALMSLGYTLLAVRIQSILNASGFDPYIGWLHRVDYGRPSLALDLLEPYRAPFIDRWVVRMFNMGVFKSGDFIEQEDGGYRLQAAALKRFFLMWDKHLKRIDIERMIRLHAQSVSKVILGKALWPQHPEFRAR